MVAVQDRTRRSCELQIIEASNRVIKTSAALVVAGGVGVGGDVYATNTVLSGNFTVDTDTLIVNSTTDRVGINKAVPTVALDVVGDVVITDDFTVDTDTLRVDSVTDRVGINVSAPDASLHVIGNAYVSSNLTVDTNTLHVDAEGNKVGILTVNPEFALDVHGTSNVGVLTATSLSVDTDTLHVDATNKRVGIETSSPAANLHVTGNVYVSSNLNVDANVFIAGGLVTNTGGVTKKTYSQTGTITSGTAPGIAIVFSDHAFSAKITAQLIESDIEISTLDIKVTGGRRGGASPSILNIAKGPLSIFGDATSNPWSTTVGATTTTVTITPSTNLDDEGHYNIFVEYVSADTGGSVSTIGGTSTGY